MSHWPPVKAKKLIAALVRIGWTVAWQSGSHRRLKRPGQEHLPPALLRLSVGIEAVEDLWTDLDRALRKLAEV